MDKDTRKIPATEGEFSIPTHLGATILEVNPSKDDLFIDVVYEEDVEVKGIEYHTVGLTLKKKKLDKENVSYIGSVQADSKLFHAYEVDRLTCREKS